MHPRRLAVVVVAVAAVVACAPDGDDAVAPADVDVSTADNSTNADSSTTTTTEVVFERYEVPPGVLAAMPQRNREDNAKNQFQVQVVNGTGEHVTVVGVQFVWSGFTTERVARHDTLVGGQRMDFPVKFPGAECVGDGGVSSMPDVNEAIAKIWTDDGRELDLPVYDTFAVARKLYLKDCERQYVDDQVGLEWAELDEVDFEGRPVTEGVLRVTRRGSDGPVRVLAVSNTVPYTVDTYASAAGEPVLELDASEAAAEAPVRFVEGRCDAHALAEVKQPFAFILQVEIDGVVHPYVLMPPEENQIPMRTTAADACEILGLNVPLG